MASAHEAARGHEALGDGVRRSLPPPAPGAARSPLTPTPGTRPAPEVGPPLDGVRPLAPAENDEAGLWEVGLLVAPDAAGAPTPDAAGDHDGAPRRASLLRAAASTPPRTGRARWSSGSRVPPPTTTPPRPRRASWPQRAGAATARDPPLREAGLAGGTTVRATGPGPTTRRGGGEQPGLRRHPEQGSWTATTLEPAGGNLVRSRGFLLAEDARGLAGFCWTKVTRSRPTDPQLGEIYVVGVDPSRQGTGLGRALVLAGLHSLAGRGPRTGMLYVDAANRPAMGLYRALGFREHRVDRAYERSVGCGGEPR